MENTENIETILILILGIFVSLFGYRLKKSIFFIAWFLIGYSLMTKIMPFINDSVPSIATSELWQWLLPIAGGLLLSLVGFSIEKICVALLCFSATIIFAINHFGTGAETLIIAAIIGVVLSGIAVTLMKSATIVITSIIGTLAATPALFELITELDKNTYYTPVLIGIGVIGIIFQFVNTKRLE